MSYGTTAQGFCLSPLLTPIQKVWSFQPERLLYSYFAQSQSFLPFYLVLSFCFLLPNMVNSKKTMYNYNYIYQQLYFAVQQSEVDHELPIILAFTDVKCYPNGQMHGAHLVRYYAFYTLMVQFSCRTYHHHLLISLFCFKVNT